MNRLRLVVLLVLWRWREILLLICMVQSVFPKSGQDLLCAADLVEFCIRTLLLVVLALLCVLGGLLGSFDVSASVRSAFGASRTWEVSWTWCITLLLVRGLLPVG